MILFHFKFDFLSDKKQPLQLFEERLAAAIIEINGLQFAENDADLERRAYLEEKSVVSIRLINPYM